jgi:hypothetical protein
MFMGLPQGVEGWLAQLQPAPRSPMNNLLKAHSYQLRSAGNRLETAMPFFEIL